MVLLKPPASTPAAPLRAPPATTTAAAATLDQTKAALDAVASKSGFRCVPVSWEDAQRGTVGGALSCWGGNISDVRLWEKGGQLLYTLRSQNWNERLGYVASKDVAVVTGNHVRGGAPVAPITLQKYLKNIKEYAGYAGVTSEQLWDETADQLLSIRFQAVFLPIKDKEATEFCTEVYNYNTRSDADPRNMTLLCTAQGTSAQQDGSGAKKIFLHSVDGAGKVHRYWLEAERSEHKVGGAQLETEEEAAAAAARGKATAIHIGTKAMGTRFNVQMLIQLPLKQKAQPPRRSGALGGGGGVGAFDGFFGGKLYSKASSCDNDDECELVMESKQFSKCAKKSSAFSMPSLSFGFGSAKPSGCVARPTKPVIGTSNAARVSRGTEFDTWGGVSNTEPVRDPSQHGTITVTLYYTVAGGVPSAADVEACVADLETLYKACPSDKKLVDCSEITAELTVKNTMDIQQKVVQQPYKPPTFHPTKSTFPVDDD